VKDEKESLKERDMALECFRFLDGAGMKVIFEKEEAKPS